MLILMNPGFSLKILQPHIIPVHTPPSPPQYHLPHDPLENEKRRKGKKRKKKLDREESIASMMHSQKPNNLMSLMATSLSAAHSSTWGHASRIISEMMLILKRDLLLRIKAWVL